MNNNVYCRQESRIRYSILSISFPGQLLAIQSHHKPEMFAHLGQCHPVSICCLLSGHLPAPQVPLQIPLFPCFEEQAALPSQIPGQKVSGSLFASSPHPSISFPPQVPLSPHCPQDNIHKTSPPPLPCSQALGTFPHLTTLLFPTACRPIAHSCTCRWGPCLPACVPCLGSPSSAQKALPLLFADKSFVMIGGLVQGTTFPSSQPSQRPSQ